MLRAIRDAAIIHGWQLLPQSSQNARNRARLDRFVVPWDALASRGKPFRGRLLFTHIPKTGGTTLEHLIAKNHPPNGTLLVNSETLRRHPGVFARFGGLPRAVMGHHKLNQPIYRLINRRFAHITMLREPVARVLSHFDYLRESPNHAMHARASDLTIESFASSHLTPELANGQTLRLAGRLPRSISSRTRTDPRALDTAKENLERRFSLFGLTERYSAFLLMAARALGWEDPFAQRKNASKRRTRAADVPERTLLVIRERNALDLALYAFATELFERRRAEIGITDERVAQFEADQRRHSVLLTRASSISSVESERPSERRSG